MARLVTTSRVVEADDLFQRLVELHRGLTDEEILRVNAKLILLLINHIGDEEAVAEAIELSRPHPVDRPRNA